MAAAMELHQMEIEELKCVYNILCRKGLHQRLELIIEYYYLLEKKSAKLDILQTPGFHHKFKYISSSAVNNTGCTES